MQTNSDSVIRSAFYKYMHPKEVFIGESVIIPDMIHKKVRFFHISFFKPFFFLLIS